MKGVWTRSSPIMRFVLAVTLSCCTAVYAQQSEAPGGTTTATAATIASIIAQGPGERFVIKGIAPLTDSTDSAADTVTFADSAGSPLLIAEDNEFLWHLENNLDVMGAQISIALNMFGAQGQFNPNYEAKRAVVIPLGHRTVYRFLGTVEMKKLLDPCVAKSNCFLGGSDVSRQQMRAIAKSLAGYTFIGELNPRDPFAFAFLKTVGLVYVGGKGSVVLPSGKTIALGR